MNSPIPACRYAFLPLSLVTGLVACGPADVESTSEAIPVAADPALVLRDSVPVIMERAGVTGLQLVYVDSGEVALKAAFGTADSEAGTAVTDQTVFEAASLSKPVFAYAVLRMADRGEWDLDQPLWEVLEYGRLEHDERAKQLTARHVLTHTTGLPNWGGSSLDFIADPGEKWGYSGEGFVYMQRAVEAGTELTLEEIAQREVFGPLGMTSTHYVWVEAYDSLAAIPHEELGDPGQKRKPETGNAAASLHTTATDFARFVTAIMNGEGLEPTTHAAMLAPATDVSGAGQGYSAEAGVNIAWGLGWGLQDGRGGPSFWHWGDNGTFRCFVVGYPEDLDALVYFTNSRNGLVVGPAILELAFEDDHWPLQWLDYGRYDDPARLARLEVTRTFLDEGPEAGMAAFGRMIDDYPDVFDEGAVNSLGYVLLRRDAVDQAVWVFERNTIDYPESSNVWDSYGEGLRAAGQLEESIANYRKSIELDPSNENARGYIEEMEAELASG